MPPKRDAPKKKSSAPAKLGSGKKTEEKEEKDKKKNIIQEGLEFIVSTSFLAKIGGLVHSNSYKVQWILGKRPLTPVLSTRMCCKFLSGKQAARSYIRYPGYVDADE